MAVPAQETIELAICRPLGRANLGGLCEGVCKALESSGAGVAICDLSKARADAVTVEALARLQLEVRRRGYRADLCSPSTELLALVEFMGLREVLL
jgi:ABC-type transporter Mla MlaB component